MIDTTELRRLAEDVSSRGNTMWITPEDILSLLSALERYRKALEYYATKFDGGVIARTALNDTEERSNG